MILPVPHQIGAIGKSVSRSGESVGQLAYHPHQFAAIAKPSVVVLPIEDNIGPEIQN